MKTISHVSHYAIGDTVILIDNEDAYIEKIEIEEWNDEKNVEIYSVYFESWDAGIQINALMKEEFFEEFKSFFKDPRRFTYTPGICC